MSKGSPFIKPLLQVRMLSPPFGSLGVFDLARMISSTVLEAIDTSPECCNKRARSERKTGRKGFEPIERKREAEEKQYER
jgi:hypothetical protein